MVLWPACARVRDPRDLAAVACVGVALLLAERLTRSTKPAFFSFLTRVFGLLLSAIAVQFVVNGVVGLT